MKQVQLSESTQIWRLWAREHIRSIYCDSGAFLAAAVWGGHICIWEGGGKNFGWWHNAWLSEWCNLTPATHCNDVNTTVTYLTRYLATSFIGGEGQGPEFSQGATPPLSGQPLEPPLLWFHWSRNIGVQVKLEMTRFCFYLRMLRQWCTVCISKVM